MEAIGLQFNEEKGWYPDSKCRVFLDFRSMSECKEEIDNAHERI
jgi:hypothetical protein